MADKHSESLKHAYLIMAHRDFDILRRLICELDDERNDIYIHIDRKSKSFDRQLLAECVRHSNLIFIERRNIYWGHYSIVECEIALLKTAVGNGPYKYYHLLSGQDFPIRSQDFIHNIFDSSDLEYITSWECVPEAQDASNYTDNYAYYYFMNRFLDKYRYIYGNPIARFLKNLEKKSVSLQKKLGIDRSRNSLITIYKGDQWFSITDSFARFVIENETGLRRKLKLTMAPDEMLLATLAENSEFKQSVAHKNYRLIDWTRGTPYVFTNDDYDEIIASERLFVRKVSEQDSLELVDRLSEYIKGH